jgi:hypothetical protein
MAFGLSSAFQLARRFVRVLLRLSGSGRSRYYPHRLFATSGEIIDELHPPIGVAPVRAGVVHQLRQVAECVALASAAIRGPGRRLVNQGDAYALPLVPTTLRFHYPSKATKRR